MNSKYGMFPANVDKENKWNFTVVYYFDLGRICEYMVDIDVYMINGTSL
jgi:hypothetical protein